MSNFMKPVLTSIIFFLLILTSCTRDEYNLKMVAVKDGNTIWIMNVDGSDRKALTSTAEDGDCKDPSWSADCESIVYTSNFLGYNRLCIMNSDGSGKRILFTTVEALYDPSISPDNSRIIFGCTDLNLYEYRFSTGSVTVINTFSIPLVSLSISSEGRICFIDMNGAYVYTPGTGWASIGGNGSFGAIYSPDGRIIAYVNAGLLFIEASDTISLNSSGIILTNTVNVLNSQIAWDPAGEYIYYETALGISRISADNTFPEVVVNDSTFKYPQIQGKSK